MKRILLVIAAIAAVATAAVWFAAGESYVTTVRATIGTGLSVSAHGDQDLGLLFGQEERFGAMIVEINAKAKADGNLTGVQYTVGCNDGRFDSNENASTICANLVLSPTGAQKLVVDGTQSQTIAWTFTAPDCEGSAQKKVAPKTVPCSQDKNWELRGAISIDVTGYQGFIKESICDKKSGLLVNGQTGEPKLVGGEEVTCLNNSNGT